MFFTVGIQAGDLIDRVTVIVWYIEAQRFPMTELGSRSFPKIPEFLGDTRQASSNTTEQCRTLTGREDFREKISKTHS